ncbi:MAG TPA: alanine racemase [Candidatus Acidoferrum sp.]|jgi:alanine racemase|nr:alanine racemase [Candidatus Acidoferrum sp.]
MPSAENSLKNLKSRPIWAEISLGALAQNLRAIRKFVNPPEEKRKTPRKILSIVKGNGYGHGGPQVAKALEKAGSDWFGVTCTEEGIAVRKAGVRNPVLVLTSFWPGEESRLLEHDLTAVIHRCEQLQQLDRAAARLASKKGGKRSSKKFSFHLKMDTGMNRLGIAPSDVDCFAGQLAKCKHLELGGVFTHFASSEVFTSTRTGEQTRQQEERFYAALDRLRALGVDPGIVHLANSAAIATRPDTWADMVRPGAILYGYHPGYDPAERRAEIETLLPVKPVMSLRTRIINIRNIPVGAGVGYNETFIAKRPSRIAVLAAGYGDGIHRSLGNRGSVLIRGLLAPVVGIVSMDVTMIDVTDIPGAEISDAVTIHGTDGDRVHPANVIARSIGTVTSDLLCAVSQRVPRIYLK